MSKQIGQSCNSHNDCAGHSSSCPVPTSPSNEPDYGSLSTESEIQAFIEYMNYDPCVENNVYCLESVYVENDYLVCRKTGMPRILAEEKLDNDVPEPRIEWYMSPGSLDNDGIQNCKNSITDIDNNNDFPLCTSNDHSCVAGKCIQFNGFTTGALGDSCSRIDSLFETTRGIIVECQKPLFCNSSNLCDREPLLMSLGGDCSEYWQRCPDDTYCHQSECKKNNYLNDGSECGIGVTGICRPGSYCDESICKNLPTLNKCQDPVLSLPASILIGLTGGIAIGFGAFAFWRKIMR